MPGLDAALAERFGKTRSRHSLPVLRCVMCGAVQLQAPWQAYLLTKVKAVEMATTTNAYGVDTPLVSDGDWAVHICIKDRFGVRHDGR